MISLFPGVTVWGAVPVRPENLIRDSATVIEMQNKRASLARRALVSRNPARYTQATNGR